MPEFIQLPNLMIKCSQVMLLLIKRITSNLVVADLLSLYFVLNHMNLKTTKTTLFVCCLLFVVLSGFYFYNYRIKIIASY